MKWRGGDLGHVNSEILLVVKYSAVLDDYFSFCPGLGCHWWC